MDRRRFLTTGIGGVAASTLLVAADPVAVKAKVNAGKTLNPQRKNMFLYLELVLPGSRQR